MRYQRRYNCLLVAALWLVVSAAPAATLNLSNVPLSAATSVSPNVFFELDDSGSMDWEIMTQKYWTWRAYNSDESVIGGSNTSSNGGSYNDDGLWDSHTRTSGGGGGRGGGGGGTSYSYSPETFDYIFDNSDNLYGSGCGPAVIACGAFSSNFPYSLDWRILSSAMNTLYYDPSQNYSPWAGPCLTDGTPCANASFTAALSNPRQGQAGYTVTRNLTGFVYEVWVDDKGFKASDGRPRRGSNLNVTNGANGIVDLWDKHIQYTVGATSVTVVTTTYSPTSSGLNPTTSTSTITDATTVAAIQQNVANWYQYYRKRQLAAKAAIAAVISENSSFRYGLSVINNSSTLFKEVPPSGTTDFSTYNTALLAALFDYVWPAKSTPLRIGLRNAGEYYYGKLSGKTNPIISSCQKCFTLLITDGYWNDSFSAILDIDGDGIKSTLADVARYYYITDLSTLANEVPADTFDTATYQHMVTYTVAFGLVGNLADTDGDGWPNPALTESGNWGNPTACTDCAPMIDDLWHAAYNSKGRFVSAKNPAALIKSLRDAFQDISNRISSVAAVALNSGSLNALSRLYQVKFNGSTWQGFLEARSVDSGTGALGSSPWEAGTLLPNASDRVIITHNGSNGVPFTWDPVTNTTQLSAAQQTALNTNISGTVDGYGAKRLNYLRGDGSLELNQKGGIFRIRANTKLGDIVNSAPQYSGGDSFGYSESLEKASYSAYVKETKATRTPMVYVGANDGMLHGFDANTGIEKIAYVPSKVYSNLSKLTSPTYTHRYYVDGTPTIGDVFYGGQWHTVLVGSLRGGGQGIFALDVTNPDNFTQPNAGSLVLWEYTDTTDDNAKDLGYTFSRPNIVKMADNSWAAVFGNGYNNTEADSKASTSGNAVLYIVNIQTGVLIAKIDTMVGTAQDPKGAARPNGLATVTPIDMNQDGVADYIYAGDLFGNLWKFDITSTNPSNWKTAFGSVSSPVPLFKACGGTTCSGSNAQSITSRVTVGDGPGGKGNMILFGTGKYLEAADISDTSTQTFYGIWDKNDGTTTVTGRNKLLQQTVLFEGTFALKDGTSAGQSLRVTSSNHYGATPPTELGWYIDLLPPAPAAAQGERLINQPLLRNGRVIFSTIIPTANSCTGGGDSWLVGLNALDGSRVDAGTFDLNNDSTYNSDEYVQVTIGGSAQWVAVSQVKYGLLTDPKIACKSAGCKGYVSGTLKKDDPDAKAGSIGISGGVTSIGRKSWRQIK